MAQFGGVSTDPLPPGADYKQLQDWMAQLLGSGAGTTPGVDSGLNQLRTAPMGGSQPSFGTSGVNWGDTNASYLAGAQQQQDALAQSLQQYSGAGGGAGVGGQTNTAPQSGLNTLLPPATPQAAAPAGGIDWSAGGDWSGITFTPPLQEPMTREKAMANIAAGVTGPDAEHIANSMQRMKERDMQAAAEDAWKQSIGYDVTKMVDQYGNPGKANESNWRWLTSPKMYLAQQANAPKLGFADTGYGQRIADYGAAHGLDAPLPQGMTKEPGGEWSLTPEEREAVRSGGDTSGITAASFAGAPPGMADIWAAQVKAGHPKGGQW